MRNEEGKLRIIENLKVAHFFWVAFIGFVTPLATIVFVFVSAKAEINQKIDAIQLQNVQTFARQDDLKSIHKELSQIANNLSELNGYLKSQKRYNRSANE